jgi:hypothetical protein
VRGGGVVGRDGVVKRWRIAQEGSLNTSRQHTHAEMTHARVEVAIVVEWLSHTRITGHTCVSGSGPQRS